MDIKLKSNNVLPETQIALNKSNIEQHVNDSAVLNNSAANVLDNNIAVSVKVDKQPVVKDNSKGTTNALINNISKRVDNLSTTDKKSLQDKYQQLSDLKTKLSSNPVVKKDLHVLLNAIINKTATISTLAKTSTIKETGGNSDKPLEQSANKINSSAQEVKLANMSNLDAIIELIKKNSQSQESKALLLSMLMQSNVLDSSDSDEESAIDTALTNLLSNPLFASQLNQAGIKQPTSKEPSIVLTNLSDKINQLQGLFQQAGYTIPDDGSAIDNLTLFTEEADDNVVVSDVATSMQQQKDLTMLNTYKQLLLASAPLLGSTADILEGSVVTSVSPSSHKYTGVSSSLLVVNAMMYMIKTMSTNTAILINSLQVLSSIISDINSTNQIVADQQAATSLKTQANYERIDKETYNSIVQKIEDMKSSFWFSVLSNLVMDIVNLIQGIVELNPLLMAASFTSLANDSYKIYYLATTDAQDIDFNKLQNGFLGNEAQVCLMALTFIASLSTASEDIQVLAAANKIDNVAVKSIVLPAVVKISSVAIEGINAGFNIAKLYGEDIIDSVGVTAGMFLEGGIIAGIMAEIIAELNKLIGDHSTWKIALDSVASLALMVICCVVSYAMLSRSNQYVAEHLASLGPDFITTRQKINYKIVAMLEGDNIKVLEKKAIDLENMSFAEKNLNKAPAEKIKLKSDYTEAQKQNILMDQLKARGMDLASSASSSFVRLFCNSYRVSLILKGIQALNSIAAQGVNIYYTVQTTSDSKDMNENSRDKEQARILTSAINQYFRTVQQDLSRNIDSISSLMPGELSDISELLQMRNDIMSGWADV